MNNSTENGYGRCPKCGSLGVMRERRPNGNDTCNEGHVYPSKDAVYAKTGVAKAPVIPAWMDEKALEIAKRFVYIGESQRMANLQVAITEALLEATDRAPKDTLAKENRALRRMLCAVYAGSAAYMDDGEAQDNRTLPFINFMVDTPAQIQAAMLQRGMNKLQEAKQAPVQTVHFGYQPHLDPNPVRAVGHWVEDQLVGGSLPPGTVAK
jgi:hypothetical protein